MSEDVNRNFVGTQLNRLLTRDSLKQQPLEVGF